MDAIDLFNSDEMELPKESLDDDFEVSLDKILNDYRAKLGAIDGTDFMSHHVRSKLGLVDEVCARLKNATAQYLQGFPHGAYSELDLALNALGGHFDMLCPPGDMAPQLQNLYRMRISDEGSLSRQGLFHIPFQMRHRVSSQRYSVSGLPCLYLGGSAQVCRRELGMPAFAEVHISRFRAIPGLGLRVVNFGFRPAPFAARMDQHPEEYRSATNEASLILGLTACWPVMAACSIKRRYDGPFKAEYIIPQLVLQWISRTKKYDGIRYFSTHASEYFDDPLTDMNYVFPARRIAAKGYCIDLRDRFELTDPLRWDQAKQIKATAVARPQYKIRGVVLPDLEREYGQVESVMLSQPLHNV